MSIQSRVVRVVVAWCVLTAAHTPAPAAELSKTNKPSAMALARYRADLTAFRHEYGGSRELPDIAFFQFGMGARTKLLFRAGQLINARTGEVTRKWKLQSAVIVPPEYQVWITNRDDTTARIYEDEQAVWVVEAGKTNAVPGTQTPIHLPRFEEHRYASILRDLHHEILMNIIDGKPVPNFYVYAKPWYRDGAMMALCLKRTGNLDLLRDWIMDLREPFDRNNGGEREADNLGQAPKLPDSYSSLFWMDYRTHHVRGTEATDRDRYPYLGWATDYFLGTKLSPISNRDYPLTWETEASQANYSGMRIIDPQFTTKKTAAPHTWHAAEVFLYLLDGSDT